MANNPYPNKVVFGDTTVMDISDTTATPDRIYSGYECYAASGEKITGTLAAVPIDPVIFDLNRGYVTSGRWVHEYPTLCYLDVYQVVGGHRYYITFGNTVGTRARGMFTTTIIDDSLRTNVTGTSMFNYNNPSAYYNYTWTAPEDGYVTIQKDNAGTTGLHVYVYDATTAWP